MACEKKTLDSNLVGLRYTEEECAGIIAVDGNLSNTVWHPCDPNSYGSFGSTYNKSERNTINPTRQKKKGSITGSETTAGYQQDFVQHSLTDLLSGFFFADWRNKGNNSIESVSGASYTISGTNTFIEDDLVFAENCDVQGNNGLGLVTSTGAQTISVDGVSTEANSPDNAKLWKVGVQADQDDLVIEVNSGVSSLTSTIMDLSSLGFIAGEWVFIGGDDTANKFSTNECNGFYRIKSINTNEIVFDRTPTTQTEDDGLGKNIHLFFGNVLRNEPDTSLIKKKTYTFERKFTDDIFEYIYGATPNTFNVSVPEEGNITTDLSFVALSSDDVDVRLGGIFTEKLPPEDVFTSTTSLANMRLMNEDTEQTLYTILPTFNFNIANNISGIKAAGTLGSVETSVGDFTVSGSATAFFTSINAVNAIKNNDSVSLDFSLIHANQGYYFDIPYLSLGDGSKDVSKDQPIKINLETMGAEHPTLGYTMLMQKFMYLPLLAN